MHLWLVFFVCKLPVLLITCHCFLTHSIADFLYLCFDKKTLESVQYIKSVLIKITQLPSILLAYDNNIHTVEQTAALPSHPPLLSHLQLSTQCVQCQTGSTQDVTLTLAFVLFFLLVSRMNAGALFSPCASSRILETDGQIIENLHKADRLIALKEVRRLCVLEKCMH